MPANTSPIFTGTPKVSGTRITTAQANSTGTGTVGTDYFLAFSAGTNGSYLQRVRFTIGATSNTATTAAVLRVYLSTVNTGSTTSANTFLIQEVTAASQAPNVVATLTAATFPIDIPLNFAIPTGYYLLVGASAVSGADRVWTVTTYGGDY